MATQERPDADMTKGGPVTLVGPQLKPVDPADNVTYAEYVPQLGRQPDFEAVLDHLKQTVKA